MTLLYIVQQCELGLLAAAIISGIAAIGGAITSSISTNRTNNANKEMQKKQQEFDAAQTDKMNQYNSPEAQRNRLMSAGFNPFMSGGASSISQSSTQKQSPTTKALEMKNPLEGISANMQNAANDYITSANNISINQSQISKNQQDVYESMSRATGNKLQNSIIRKYGMSKQLADIQSTQAQTRLATNQANLTKINADLTAQFGSEKAANEIKLQAANISNTLENTKNVRQTIKLNFQKTLQAVQQTQQAKLTTDQMQLLFNTYVENVKAELQSKILQVKQQQYNYDSDREFRNTERSLGVQQMRENIKSTKVQRRLTKEKTESENYSRKLKTWQLGLKTLSDVAGIGLKAFLKF